MAFNDTPRKLDAVFVQRTTDNTFYEQINISASDAIVYLNEHGKIDVDPISVWSAKYNIGSGGTSNSSSWASSSFNSISASYALSSSYAVTASYAVTTSFFSYFITTSVVSMSFAETSLSASWASSSANSLTADFAVLAGEAIHATTSSHAIFSDAATSASYALSASWAPTSGTSTSSISASHADTASYILGSNVDGCVDCAISASYAVTASYVSGSSNASISASYALSSSYGITASYALTGIGTQGLTGRTGEGYWFHCWRGFRDDLPSNRPLWRESPSGDYGANSSGQVATFGAEYSTPVLTCTTNPSVPAVTVIPAGLWTSTFTAQTVSTSIGTAITAKIYKRDISGSYSLLATFPKVYLTSSNYAQYITQSTFPSFTMSLDDRLESRHYAWHDITSSNSTTLLSGYNNGGSATFFYIPLYAISASISTLSISSSYSLTASYAISASYALSASYAEFVKSASYALTSSYSITSSYALTASYISGANAAFADSSSHALFADTASYLSNSFDNFQSITTKNYLQGNLNVDYLDTTYRDAFSILFAPNQKAYVNLTLCNSASVYFYGEYFIAKDSNTRIRQPGYILRENNLGDINIISTIYEPGLSSSNAALTVQMATNGATLISSSLTYEVRGCFLSAPVSSTPTYPDSGSISILSGSGDSFEAYAVQNPITDTLNSNTGFSGSWRIVQAYPSMVAYDTFDSYTNGGFSSAGSYYNSFTNWDAERVQLVGSGSGVVVEDVYPNHGAYAKLYGRSASRLTTKANKINLTSGSYLVSFIWGSLDPVGANNSEFELRLLDSNLYQEFFVGQYHIPDGTGSYAISVTQSQDSWRVTSTGNPLVVNVTQSCYLTMQILQYNNTSPVGYLFDVLVRDSASLSTIFHDDFDQETLTLGTSSLNGGSGWSGAWRVS